MTGGFAGEVHRAGRASGSTCAVAHDRGDDAQDACRAGLLGVYYLEGVQDPVAHQHGRIHRMGHGKKIRQTCSEGAGPGRWQETMLQQRHGLGAAFTKGHVMPPSLLCSLEGVSSESVGTATASAPADSTRRAASASS